MINEKHAIELQDIDKKLWITTCRSTAETFPDPEDMEESLDKNEIENHLVAYWEQLIKIILKLEELSPTDLRKGVIPKFHKRKKELEETQTIKLQTIATKQYFQDKELKEKEIELPGNDRTSKEFAIELAEQFRGTEIIFHKPEESETIEIVEYHDKDLDIYLVGFKTIKPTRLINIIENNINCYRTEYIKNAGDIRKKKTPSKTLAEYLLENDDLEKAIYSIKRLLKTRMPFIIKGELVIPKPGYNEEINAYVVRDSPEIIDMTLTEAKEIIKDLFKEFCFKEELDRTMAIAGLLTPACRGLYKRRTCNTPIFLYLANRERSGKDQCAAITSITYEGQKIENGPVSDSERNTNNTEELRKKITSLLRKGQRRYHSANCKGRIDNAVLENITTNEFWQDRILGGNEDIILPNEMDFSISANVGISWTADLWNRSRPVNLFFADEDPNQREFSRNLDDFVLENRSRIQSAIITIIKEWFKAGQPKGGIFASFQEWARVVGGIMNFCNFGDPTISLADESDVGGDTETINFRQLFELMNEIQSTTLEKSHKVSQIASIIKARQIEGSDLFSYYDFEKNSDKMKFGKTFKKYIGRIFSKIKLQIALPNAKSERITYAFIKDNQKVGTLGGLGTCNPLPHKELNKNIMESKKGTKRPQSPQDINLPIVNEEIIGSKTDIIHHLIEINKPQNFNDILAFIGDEDETKDTINKLLLTGDIIEIKKDIYQVNKQ